MTGIPNYFQTDNFLERRSGSETSYGVKFDPEGFITGAEAAAGLTYRDKRVWPDKATYDAAVAGKIPAHLIPSIAPRVKISTAPNQLDALLASSGLSPFATGSAIGV
jgi:hypothetical protein